MLELFPDEQIITQSSDGEVTLTTHRICYEYKEWGRTYNQNIMLEHITSCENYFSTQVWLLLVGGLCLIVGLVETIRQRSAEAFGIAALWAIGFGIVYWLTRRNFIVISSPSTKMKIKVMGMRRGQVLDFINKVEQTKNKRILVFNNRPNAVD